MRNIKYHGWRKEKNQRIYLKRNCQRGKRKTRSVEFGNRGAIFKGAIFNNTELKEFLVLGN